MMADCGGRGGLVPAGWKRRSMEPMRRGAHVGYDSSRLREGGRGLGERDGIKRRCHTYCSWHVVARISPMDVVSGERT